MFTESKYFKDAEVTITVYKMEFTVKQSYSSIYMTDSEGSILVDGYVYEGQLCLHSISDKLHYFQDEVRSKITKALKLRK